MKLSSPETYKLNETWQVWKENSGHLSVKLDRERAESFTSQTLATGDAARLRLWKPAEASARRPTGVGAARETASAARSGDVSVLQELTSR